MSLIEHSKLSLVFFKVCFRIIESALRGFLSIIISDLQMVLNQFVAIYLQTIIAHKIILDRHPLPLLNNWISDRNNSIFIYSWHMEGLMERIS